MQVHTTAEENKKSEWKEAEGWTPEKFYALAQQPYSYVKPAQAETRPTKQTQPSAAPSLKITKEQFLKAAEQPVSRYKILEIKKDVAKKVAEAKERQKQDIAKEIYQQATPFQRGLANVQTLFSSRSAEYIGSFFTKGKKPEDVTIKNIRTAMDYKQMTTGQKAQYYAGNILGNIPTQLAVSYGLGYGTSATLTKVGSAGLNKALAVGGAGLVAKESYDISKEMSENKEKAIGHAIGLAGSIAMFGAGAKAYKTAVTKTETIIGLKETKVSTKPTPAEKLGKTELSQPIKTKPTKNVYLYKEIQAKAQAPDVETITIQNIPKGTQIITKPKKTDLINVIEIGRSAGLRSGSVDVVTTEKGMLFVGKPTKPEPPKPSKLGELLGKITGIFQKPTKTTKESTPLKLKPLDTEITATKPTPSPTTNELISLDVPKGITSSLTPIQIKTAPEITPTFIQLTYDKELADLKPKVTPEIKPIQITEQKQEQKIIEGITPRPKPPKPKTTQEVDIIVTPKIKVTPKITPEETTVTTSEIEIIPRPTPQKIKTRKKLPPKFLDLDIPSGFGLTFGRRKKPLRQKTRYEPSLLGQLLEIKAPKKTKELFTGFEIRGIKQPKSYKKKKLFI